MSQKVNQEGMRLIQGTRIMSLQELCWVNIDD